MQRSISNVSVIYPADSTMDSELSNMFGSLSLQGWTEPQAKEEPLDHAQIHVSSLPHSRASSPAASSDSDSGSEGDAAMMEVTDAQGNVQYIEQPIEEPTPGCGLLHLMQSHYMPSQHACQDMRDTDFNFLDTILTHREAFVAFPQGHRTCSKALTQIAFALERRAQEQRAGDGDLDTAIALHNEAWLMSGWYST